MSARVLAMPVKSAAPAMEIPGRSRPHSLTTAIVRAAARVGLTDEQLADLMGLSAGQWSKQKAGREGHRMHVQRFDQLPDDIRALFLDALLDELAVQRGRVVVRPAGHLAHMARAMRSMSDALEEIAATTPQPSLPLEGTGT